MNVFGELKKALLEKLASDPVTNLVSGRIYYNTTTNEAKIYNGTSWESVGSGGGGDSLNYASGDNTDFDTAVGSGWTTYDDAAATPVDGQGGTVALTAVRSTSSPLHGAGSLLITPGGLGEGAAFSFALNRRDLATVMEVNFPYEIGTYASYTDGDFTVWYISASDSGYTTNLEVVQLAPYKILKASGQEIWKGIFQTHATNGYGRVVIHQATAATGYTLKLDDFYVGPQKSAPSGAVVTDWQSFTMSIQGSVSNPSKGGTITTDEARWRRVGDSMEISYRYRQTSAGSGGSGDYMFVLPSGYSIDTTKYPISQVPVIGSAYIEYTSSSTIYSGEALAYTSNSIALKVYDTSSATGSNFYAGSSFSPLSTAIVGFSFIAKVPILGWSSNTIMSHEAGDQRVVAAKVTSSTSSISSSGVTPVFVNKSYDSHGAMSLSGIFTAPSSGYYQASGYALSNNSDWTTEGQSFEYHLFKDSTRVAVLGRQAVDSGVASAHRLSAGGTSVVYLNAGETLKPVLYSDITGALPSGDANCRFEVSKIQGPSQVAATETVSVIASNSSGMSIGNGGNAVWKFTNIEKNSHGSYSASTGIFTAPVSGEYLLAGLITTADLAASSDASQIAISIYENGTRVELISKSAYTTASIPHIVTFASKVRLLAGQEAYINVDNGMGNLFTGNSENDRNRLSITRVGNY